MWPATLRLLCSPVAGSPGREPPVLLPAFLWNHGSCLAHYSDDGVFLLFCLFVCLTTAESLQRQRCAASPASTERKKQLAFSNGVSCMCDVLLRSPKNGGCFIPIIPIANGCMSVPVPL